MAITRIPSLAELGYLLETMTAPKVPNASPGEVYDRIPLNALSQRMYTNDLQNQEANTPQYVEEKRPDFNNVNLVNTYPQILNNEEAAKAVYALSHPNEFSLEELNKYSQLLGLDAASPSTVANYSYENNKFSSNNEDAINHLMHMINAGKAGNGKNRIEWAKKQGYTESQMREAQNRINAQYRKKKYRKKKQPQNTQSYYDPRPMPSSLDTVLKYGSPYME